eukprot:4458040-Pleurochrysis_carterae.AAC.1
MQEVRSKGHFALSLSLCPLSSFTRLYLWGHCLAQLRPLCCAMRRRDGTEDPSERIYTIRLRGVGQEQ